MINPGYFTKRLRVLLSDYEPSRERSLAITKLDEFEMWLERCTQTEEALTRDESNEPV